MIFYYMQLLRPGMTEEFPYLLDTRFKYFFGQFRNFSLKDFQKIQIGREEIFQELPIILFRSYAVILWRWNRIVVTLFENLIRIPLKFPSNLFQIKLKYVINERPIYFPHFSCSSNTRTFFRRVLVCNWKYAKCDKSIWVQPVSHLNRPVLQRLLRIQVNISHKQYIVIVGMLIDVTYSIHWHRGSIST